MDSEIVFPVSQKKKKEEEEEVNLATLAETNNS